MNGEPPIRIGVLGAGGLGRAACRIIAMKRELRLIAICDSRGLVVSREGLHGEWLTSATDDDVVKIDLTAPCPIA